MSNNIPQVVGEAALEGFGNMLKCDLDKKAPAAQFGNCATSASETVKKVNIPNFELVEGASVIIYFQSNVTKGNSIQLNVSDTKASTVWYRGLPFKGPISAGDVVQFVYKGGSWRIVGVMNKDVDELNTKLALFKTPDLLYTGNMFGVALNTYSYTRVNGLEEYAEVRLWVEIGDATQAFFHVSQDDTLSTFVASGYLNANYNGCMEVRVDFGDDRVGVCVKAMAGWTYSDLKVTRVEGLVHTPDW